MKQVFRYGLELSGLVSLVEPGLYDFINVTFNNGGQTGANGPTLSQARSTMAGQGVGNWNNNTLYYNVDSNGVQSWTASKIWNI